VNTGGVERGTELTLVVDRDDPSRFGLFGADPPRGEDAELFVAERPAHECAASGWTMACGSASSSDCLTRTSRRNPEMR
jgi:hypothetical protein